MTSRCSTRVLKRNRRLLKETVNVTWLGVGPRLTALSRRMVGLHRQQETHNVQGMQKTTSEHFEIRLQQQKTGPGATPVKLRVQSAQGHQY